MVWTRYTTPPNGVILTDVWGSPRLSFTGIFADGFEDGDTGSWFNTVP